MKIIFDASAALAILNAEPGADFAIAHLAQAAMSTVNISEIAAKLLERGDDVNAARMKIETLGLIPVAVDLDLCWRAAQLRPVTRMFGLSLADRFCIALAEREKLPVITADRQWASVGLKVPVMLVR